MKGSGRLLVAGFVGAAIGWYVMYLLLGAWSCGSFSEGPRQGAEETFCGNPGSGYGALFHASALLPSLVFAASAIFAYRQSDRSILRVGALIALATAILLLIAAP